MEDAKAIVLGAVPSTLDILEPSVGDVHVGMDMGDGGERGSAVAYREALAGSAARILDACSSAFSSWFSCMRSAISRERARQKAFRKANGLPRSVKLPYEPPALTDSEKASSSLCRSMVDALFGPDVASYAQDKFSQAIQTGDLRSFKIRLLFLRARDSLRGSLLFTPFSAFMQESIDRAEALAGCIPDPSPRRLSIAEQERRRQRDQKRAALKGSHPELSLLWPNENDVDDENAKGSSPDRNGTSRGGVKPSKDFQDKIHKLLDEYESSTRPGSRRKPPKNRDANNANDTNDTNDTKYTSASSASSATPDNASPDDSVLKNKKNLDEDKSEGNDSAKDRSIDQDSREVRQDIENMADGQGGAETCRHVRNPVDNSETGIAVTTHTPHIGVVVVNKPENSSDGEKKESQKNDERYGNAFSRYTSVIDVISDIEEGRLPPYKSTEEICKDLKAGKITEVEAIMFTAALEKSSPSKETLSDVEAEELEREVDEVCNPDEEFGDTYDEYGQDRDDREEEDFASERRGTVPFSYNPNGFCGMKEDLGDYD